jgi:hypothetical protein
MKRLKKEDMLSPPAIFIWYILASFVVVMAVRLFYPGEAPPLRIFSRPWRLVRGILSWISLFPALTMSALVIPFGLQNTKRELYSRFSPQFLDSIKGSVITAICAAALYGVLCFLVYPPMWNREANMRFRGRLFVESWAKTREHAMTQEWAEAGQFLAVCERIWPNSPDLEELRTMISIELDESRFNQGGSPQDNRRVRGADTQARPVVPRAGDSADGISSRWDPVDAVEALSLAETAFQAELYYDSHWLATLAGQLAKAGSVETVEAARAASRAWNAIASLEPNSRELEAVRLYQLKNSGYEALIAADWIRGYYIFNELNALTPRDPDVANFMAECEINLRDIAFFIDETEMTLGGILSGAVFSIPRRTSSGIPFGRMVLRVESLAAGPDYSYGMGIELLIFDEAGKLVNRLEAPFSKFLPKTLASQSRVLLLLQALDREDQARRWEPVWTSAGYSELGDMQVVLDIPYEDFLLTTQVRRGVANFFIGELFTAEKKLGDYGYISQVFAAEVLSRFAEPVYFLALLILILTLGWRYRAPRRPRYLSIPMLVILPLGFDGVIRIYRAAMNILGIRLVLSLPFSAAMAVTFVGALVLFIVFLICLAYQHD